MSELTDALIQRLPSESVRTGIAVEDITESARGYALTLSGGEQLEAPAILLATPPAVTANLVRRVDPDFADLCGRIRAASVVTVALGYRRSSVRHPLDGTGLVVPRREGMTIRALSWVSSKWAGRAPEAHVLLRAYLGGTQDPDAIDQSDEALIATACCDTAALVNTVGDPELARVYRWPDATPQLEVGHADLMWKIEHRLNLRPSLALSASGFRGTGIADCVADARQQARRAAERIRAAAFGKGAGSAA
jgi:oxygen-dependent protoporphyrinogen oxidase